MNVKRLNDPRFSADCLRRGLRLLADPEIRRFVWIPLLINLGLYAAALFAGIHYFSAFMNWALSGWLEFLRWLLWPLFALTFLAVIYLTFTAVANLIGSPFYGALAEKVMARSRTAGVLPPQPTWIKSTAIGLDTEIRRLGYFLARAIPLLILFVIPGVNLIAPFAWLAFNAWFLAMEYLAFPLELLGVGFREQRQMLRPLRWGTLGFGGLAMLGLAIPGLNVLIPPAAVIGAALYVAEGGLRATPPAGAATR